MRKVALDGEITRVVLDRNGAGAGVFGDLARDDIDERRPLVVAMPGYFATRSNLQPPHPEMMPRNCDLFIREVDFAEQLFRDVFVRGCPRLLSVGCDHFASRAFARACRSGSEQERA